MLDGGEINGPERVLARSLFAQAFWEAATADTGWPPSMQLSMQAKVCQPLGRALCIRRVREGRSGMRQVTPGEARWCGGRIANAM